MPEHASPEEKEPRRAERRRRSSRERPSLPAALKVAGWLNLAYAAYCVVLVVGASLSVPSYAGSWSLRDVVPFFVVLGVLVTWAVLSIALIQGRRLAVVLWGVIPLLFVLRLLSEPDDLGWKSYLLLGLLIQLVGLVCGLACWRDLPKPEGSWRRRMSRHRPFDVRKAPSGTEESPREQKGPTPPPLPEHEPRKRAPLRTAYQRRYSATKRRGQRVPERETGRVRERDRVRERGRDRERDLAHVMRETRTQADFRMRKAVLLTAVVAAAVGFGVALLLQPAPPSTPGLDTPEPWQERRARERTAKSAAHHVERGLQELQAGAPERAIPHLARAYALGEDSVPVRFLLTQACLPPGGGRWTLAGHGERIVAVDVDPSGQLVVTASEDGTARLWDARDGRSIHTLVGHRGPLTAVCFGPEGLRVATAGTDGMVGVWETETGERIATLEGHRGAVHDVVFSPGGTRLLTVGADGTLRAWSASDGEPRTSLVAAEEAPVRLVLSPNGSRVVGEGASGRLQVWDGDSGAALQVLGDAATRFQSVVFGPEGRRFAAASHLGKLHVWDSVSARILHVLDAEAGAVHDLAFDATGDLVATAHENGTVWVWMAATGEPVSRLAGHQGPVSALAWLPDASLLLSAGADGQAHVWDASVGTRLATLEGDGTSLVDARTTPDGTRAVLAARDGKVRLWDVHLERRSPEAVLAWARECVPWRLVHGRLQAADLPADRRRFAPAEPPPPPPVELPASVGAPPLLPGQGCESVDLRVELFARSAVAIGQPFEASARVVNTGSARLERVVLGIAPETGLQHVGRDELVVRVASLDSGASHEIARVFVAGEAGTCRLLATALAGAGRAAASQFLDLVAHAPDAATDPPEAVEAGSFVDCALSTTVEPREVLAGNPFVVKAQVTNTGDVALEDVVLVYAGGAWAEHIGEEPLELTISRLAPGSTREHACTFVARQAGPVPVHVTARDQRGRAAASGHCVVEAQGLLAVELTAVDLASDHRREGVFEVGEEVRYLVEVANDHGSAPTDPLVLTLQLPPELVFVSGEAGREVTLTPGDDRRLVTSSAFVLTPNERRRIGILARVESVSHSGLVQTGVSVAGSDGVVLAAETESTTVVDVGASSDLPAYELEMADAGADGQPKGVFELGETFLYTLTVRNDGSGKRTPKLDVVFALPEPLVFVSGRGDHGIAVTGSGREARTSDFTIGPGQVRTIEVLVTCVAVPDGFLVTTTASLGDATSGLEIAREEASTTLRPRRRAR